MKILLVEDNLLNQKVVGFHLKKKNYNVLSVTNWRDALEIVKNQFLDLILMDIMLPEMNGFEITAEIRKWEQEEGKEKSIPIVALTANTLDNDKEKCLQAGMDDYLPKPFSAEELYEVINQLSQKGE